ncbi:MAG: nucleotide pyrophosphohydrolase [Bacteroidetes bacterium]|nr:nucleotide pyrophosphohydrolase [Bacteroidota bacterium]
MSDLQELTNKLLEFRNARDWEQFHDSKNLATAISIEAAELNELFLWKNLEQSEEVDRDKIKDEIADILAYTLLLAERHGFNVKEIVLEKIAKNNEKYPVEKAKGNSKKYTEL